MINFSTPLVGLERASSAVDKAVVRIARVADPFSGDTVDLSEEMVALMSARLNFSANIKVAQTFDQMSRNLLDMLA